VELQSVYEEYKGPYGSGIHIQLEYELFTGEFLNLEIQQGTKSDCQYPKVIQEDIQPGDLCLRDWGYFSIDNLLDIQKREGYFQPRIKNDINLYQQDHDRKFKKKFFKRNGHRLFFKGYLLGKNLLHELAAVYYKNGAGHIISCMAR